MCTARALCWQRVTLLSLVTCASQDVYSLADLTDITIGSADRYSAGPGYDLLTGMGVPNCDFTKAWLKQNGSVAR